MRAGLVRPGSINTRRCRHGRRADHKLSLLPWLCGLHRYGRRRYPCYRCRLSVENFVMAATVVIIIVRRSRRIVTSSPPSQKSNITID